MAAGASEAAATSWTGIGVLIGFGLAAAGAALAVMLKNEACTIQILNNTPYTIVFESYDYASYGTLGAIYLTLVDQDTGNNLTARLALAWSDPYSGSNWTSVAVGQQGPLPSWFSQVSGSSPGLSSAATILPAGNYPGFTWSASMSSSHGSNVQVTAALNVVPAAAVSSAVSEIDSALGELSGT